MRTKLYPTGAAVLLIPIVLVACLGAEDDGTQSADEANQGKRHRCLRQLEEPNPKDKYTTVAVCRELCETAKPDRVACGAMALAHLQEIGEELARYASFLRPTQSPAELATQAQQRLHEYAPLLDVRQIIEPYLATLVENLRGIRKGAYAFVGNERPGSHDELVVAVRQVPLDPGLVSILYGDKANSLALKGGWGAKEFALLGAAANAALAIVDLLYSHDLIVNVPNDPSFDSVEQAISTSIAALDASRTFLTLADPDALALARNETHAAVSLLAGRTNDLEGVARANPGFLGSVQQQFAAAATKDVFEERFLVLRDVDGDGKLSRGDAVKIVYTVNDQDVELALPYPISAKLTQTIFDFFAGLRDNLDGNGLPVHIAPVVNSAFKEVAMLSGTRTMPDVIALDPGAFFANFRGLRGLLPYWYFNTNPTTPVNPYYFDLQASTQPYQIAYEEEVASDRTHFTWVTNTNIDWLEFSAARPAGFGADGVYFASARTYYILWQDPTFAQLLLVNTTPLVSFGVLPTLGTDGQFVLPDNLTVNAVVNGLIAWSRQ